MKLDKYDYVKKYIKVLIGVGAYRKILRHANERNNNRRAILIGTPIHSNLGDHLIASQCVKFLDTLKYDEVIEIPEFVFELFSNRIHLQETDDIYIAGGGWMGDLYEDQLVIEEILSTYKGNRVVILPQTIHFTGKGKFSSPEAFAECFNECKSGIISLRDRKSYEYCVDNLNLPKERCYLLPDMALLSLSNINSVHDKKTKRIIFALRHDVERIPGMDLIEEYARQLSSRGFESAFSSTIAKEKIVSISKRNMVLEQKRREFGQAELIITDRLHSMVMALSAGTKCIAIDNATHKVTGVYAEWLNDMPGLYVFSGANQVTMDLIENVINSAAVPTSISFSEELTRFSDVVLRGDKDE